MSNILFKATYADFKLVKTRKTAQFVFEVPIENVNSVISMVGMPDPASEEWFAIAKLNSGAGVASSAPPQEAEKSPPAPSRKREDMSYAQRAGMLSNNPAFWEFIGEENETIAAAYIRKACGVQSRAEIEKSEDSKRAFDAIYNTFDHHRKYGRLE